MTKRITYRPSPAAYNSLQIECDRLKRENKQLLEEIALLKKGCPFEAENKRLRKQVEELSKPVTKEEFSKYYPHSVGVREVGFTRSQIDDLIAARAGKELVK